MQLIAMGQFEQMIRFDAELRNFGSFSVYTHPTAYDDSLAVVYMDVSRNDQRILNATRLNLQPIPCEWHDLSALLRVFEERVSKTFNNGLLAFTARSERYTADFAKLLSKDPIAALQRVMNDPAGYQYEYHSYTAPQSMRMISDVGLAEAANWICENQGSVRSYITFTHNREDFTVLGRQFREESFMMLSSYNPVKQMAYFDGMVAGRPLHQRVALDPVKYQGDRLFIEQLSNGNIVSEYGSMWRIRHLGVTQNEDGEWHLRGPHIAGFDIQLIPSKDEHDFIENRIVIL